MADEIGTKVSQLPLGENLADSDIMYAVEGGISKKVEVGYLKEVFGGGSDVSITPTLQSGTKIADYVIDGTSGAMYVPTAPTALSELTDDSTHRVVTDAEKTTWNGKADTSDIPTDADELDYDNTSSGLTADNVQDAIDEVDDNLEALISGVAVEVMDNLNFNVYTDKVINSLGVVTNTTGASYQISDLIDVEEGYTYNITASANWRNSLYAWYDENENVLSNKNSESGSTITAITDEEAVAPPNAKYLRIAFISPRVGSVKHYGGYKNNLEDRVSAIEQVIPTQGRVSLTKSLNNLIIKDVSSGMYLTATLNGSNNGAFNFGSYYKSNDDVYKSAGDDISPIYYDKSHRCGNHGNLVGVKITASSHGLTVADIGKVITSADNVDYVIIKIVDSDTFWVINDSDSYTFVTTIPTSPFSGSGLNIAFSEGVLQQILPGINNKYQAIYCDGELVTANGNYEGTNITVVDGYYSIDTLDMIAYLKENVGTNTNDSYYSDDISPDLLYETKYITKSGLRTVVSSTILILRDNINLTSWSCTQAQAFGNPIKVYAGDSLDTAVVSTSGNKYYGTAEWKDEQFPPHKFFMFDNTDANKGIVISYDITYGDCVPAKRVLKTTSQAGGFSGQRKLYPYVLSTNTANRLSKGDILKANALRMPISNSTPFVLTYSIGDKTIVEVDTFTDGLNAISIPQFDGKEVEVIHTSSGVSVIDNVITSGTFRIYGKGSASFRIS